MIHSASGPFGGLFQPQGRLADLDGKEITGIWSLHVTDRVANSDRGILADWSLLVDLWPPMNGNANHDSSLDAEDIDLLYANLGSHDVTYDLDADGDIDQADVEHLVLNLLGTHFGDVELDFDVDIPDFNVVAMHYDPLGQSRLNGWVHGNFDDDDDVDISDALQLMVNYAPFGFNAIATAGGDDVARSLIRKEGSPLQIASAAVDDVSLETAAKSSTTNRQMLSEDFWASTRSIRPRQVAVEVVLTEATTSPRHSKINDLVFEEQVVWRLENSLSPIERVDGEQ